MYATNFSLSSLLYTLLRSDETIRDDVEHKSHLAALLLPNHLAFSRIPTLDLMHMINLCAEISQVSSSLIHFSLGNYPCTMFRVNFFFFLAVFVLLRRLFLF